MPHRLHVDSHRPSAWLWLAPALIAALAGCGIVTRGQNADGVRQFQQGNYQEALVRFQQAIGTNPEQADGYYNLAATYHRLGMLNHRQEDLDQAEVFYNQCLDRDGNHADCYRGLAVLLVEEQRSEEAFRLLDGWAERSPSTAAPRVELARLWQESGDREKAKQHLLEALAADPYDARALAALGRLYEETGNPTQALANYQRSLWHDRFQPEVAARVAALRSAVSVQPQAAPGAPVAPNGSRTVATPGPSVR